MCVCVHICVFADVFSAFLLFLLLADAPIKLMPMFTWDPVSNNGLDAKYIFYHEYRQLHRNCELDAYHAGVGWTNVTTLR